MRQSRVLWAIAKKSSRFRPRADGEVDQASRSGYARPVVQWYPGHIAKAERELSRKLKLVDVVVEVRDARALHATSHPKVATWCAGRPRLLAITHADQIPKRTVSEWKSYFETFGAAPFNKEQMDRRVASQGEQVHTERSKYAATDSNGGPDNRISSQPSSNVEAVLFVNGATGSGIPALKRAIGKYGEHVQERRRARGLLRRPLRVTVLGYPNCGKSSILNKLLGVKRAPTSNRPGVTRALQWIRVKDEDDLEMLDSPGVIPASLVNQGDAALLAACNCIGEAAYDNQAVAAYLCDWLLALYRSANQIGERAAPDWPDEVKTRYKLDPFKDPELTGEDMLYMVAENTCKGNTEDASRKILQDFRTGRMGPICLQLAPAVPTGSPSISPQENESDTAIADEIQSQWKRDEERRKQERARLAFETAKNRGLELPPGVVANPDPGNGKATTGPPLDGKGLFEGW